MGRFTGIAGVLLAEIMFGSAVVTFASPPADVGRDVSPAAAVAAVTSTVDVPRHSSVVVAAKRAADYYRTTYAVATDRRNGWVWATYFDQHYRAVGDERYRADLSAWGTSNGWAPASGETNPDSVKAGQTYFDVQPLVPTATLAPMDARMSADLTGLPVAQYYWIDALYMGMPNWPRWAARTGNPAYLDKMHTLYLWTRNNGTNNAIGCAGQTPGLYDAAEHLWYRDCRFVGQRDGKGQKLFWARGNAWVLAGMAELLDSLPAGDPRTTCCAAWPTASAGCRAATASGGRIC